MLVLSEGHRYGDEPFPEGTHFTVRDMPELILSYPNFTPKELRSIKHSEIYYALAVRGPVIFLLYHIPGAFAWSDAPFTAHRLGEDQLAWFDRVEASDENQGHWLTRVIALESHANTVLRLRAATWPPHFVRKFAELVREQLAKPYDEVEYAREVQRVYGVESPGDLMKTSIVTARGGI